MKYWLFNCNPKLWEVDEFLKSGTTSSSYNISKSHKSGIQRGDMGFIRVGIDNRTKKQLNGRDRLERGVYAIVKITGDPEMMYDNDDPYWLDEEKKNEQVMRVAVTFTHNLIDKPVLIDGLPRANEIEKVAAVLTGHRTITAEVPKSDFDIILENCEANLDSLLSLEKEPVSEHIDIVMAEKKYVNETPQVKERLSKYIERGGIAKAIKKHYDYECLICKALSLPSKGFLKRNKEPYIETHHFFPVSDLKQGSLGVNNLMTLCANHHREIHYGMIDSIESNDIYFVIEMNDQIYRIEKKLIDHKIIADN